MSDEPAFLTSLLDSLDDEVNTVLNNSDIPVVKKDGTFKAQDIPSVDGYGARIGILEAGYDAQERRLAAARGTKEGEELAPLDLK